MNNTSLIAAWFDPETCQKVKVATTALFLLGLVGPGGGGAGLGKTIGRLGDDVPVVRGGTNWDNPSGSSIDPNGNLQGVSVNSKD